MQLNRNILLTIDGNSIRWIEIKRRLFCRKINCIKNEDFIEINSDTYFKRDRVYVMIENEEIYTRLITIPKVKRAHMDTIIENELKYYFNSGSNMMYNYSVLKKMIIQ